MQVLVPIDGSDCSFRALRFAIEFAERFDASLHIVHITDAEAEPSTAVLDRARDLLAEEDHEATTELLGARNLSDPGYANQIGKDVLKLVEDRGYDHIIMGHHGTGAVGRIIVGSAAETVLRACEVPATIVP